MEEYNLIGYSADGELLYSCDSPESPDSNEEAGLTHLTGFFTEYDDAEGQFDLNAEKYRENQIEMANYLEDYTGVSFWETKAKFAEYDYHLCIEHVQFMDTPAYVIWQFTDCYMYYLVDLDDHFAPKLGRNTYTTKDFPEEYKPQIEIPISKLNPISQDMFHKGVK